MTSSPSMRTVPASTRPQPGERVDHLRLAVPVDARDADDLAGAHLERDAAHLLEAAVVVDAEALDLEQRLAGLGRGLLHPEEHLASHHQAGEARLRRALGRQRLDELAAAQDGDPVGDVERPRSACG